MSQRNNKDNIFTFRSVDANQPSGVPPSVNDQARLDFGGTPPHHQNMEFVTPREFDARIETIETKVGAQISSLNTKIDDFIKASGDRDARMAKNFEDAKEESKSLRYWMIGTALATVVGLYAANISIVQTMIASFESGKSVSAAIAEINRTQGDLKKQSEDTATLLRQTQQTLQERQKGAISKQPGK